MKFRGRIGFTILLFLLIINVLAFWQVYNDPGDMLSTTIIIVIILFIDILMLDITLRNYTIINGNKMFVRMGIFKLTIPCDEIVSINASYCPLSSMSMSLKRLAIKYKKENLVYISVKKEAEFITELKKINPGIKILKKRTK